MYCHYENTKLQRMGKKKEIREEGGKEGKWCADVLGEGKGGRGREKERK